MTEIENERQDAKNAKVGREESSATDGELMDTDERQVRRDSPLSA
jgi:hypothetical protein